MCDSHPLPLNSIRLLRIKPELSNGHVDCTLSQFDDEIPIYDALSYVWGDPTPTRKINVNNSLISIHEALWEFLDQMQRSSQTENWIWTDFLCLNQTNDQEMGQQIPRMGLIYSRATRTIAWLGCSRSSCVSSPDGMSTASPDIEKDLTLIRKKVSEKRAPVEKFFAKPQLLSWTSVTRLNFAGARPICPLLPELSAIERRDLDLPKPIKEVVQLGQGYMTAWILNILSLPYWTRVWIAQEVALAKVVTLMFGGVSLDFQDFFLAYKSHFYFELKHSKEIPALPVPIEARAAVNENHVSFPLIVKWGLDCNASKPVDRIYGLLGLLACCGDDSRTLPSTLNGTIDYRRDPSDLFWDVAFTRPFSTGSFTAEDKAEVEGVEAWVDALPALGKILSCPFNPDNLRNVVNNSVTPLYIDKAHLALLIVEICRQAWIGGETLWVLPERNDDCWLTKRHARRLFFEQRESLTNRIFQFPRLMGSMFLEASNLRGMDENDGYQAVCIGMMMSEPGPLGSSWNCGSNQIMSEGNGTDPEHDIDVTFDCGFDTASSQLPCSLRTEQHSHQCRTMDRYLTIPGTAWILSVKNLSYESETHRTYWRGKFNVQIAGQTAFHAS